MPTRGAITGKRLFKHEFGCRCYYAMLRFFGHETYRGEEPDDKLLYDGDIVYIPDWQCYSVVYWYHGSWFLKFDFCDEYLYENAGMCEIVGTIHEHPELLSKI